MSGGSRGANAWEDSRNTWSEYGNPHSVMGRGDIEGKQPDIVLAAKTVFDWLPQSLVKEVRRALSV